MANGPVTFQIDADLREAQRYIRELGPGVNRAAARAINKTLTPVRAEAARKIRLKRNLKIGVIKKAMSVRRATARFLTGIIVASGKPIPIRHFDARRSKLGVSVKVAKARVRLSKYGNKTFTVAKAGGNVFVRKGPHRLPIEKWPPAPGIPKVFVQEQVELAMRTTAGQVWPKRFNEELHYELRKAAAKARSA